MVQIDAWDKYSLWPQTILVYYVKDPLAFPIGVEIQVIRERISKPELDILYHISMSINTNVEFIGNKKPNSGPLISSYC
ncbi:peroxinectin [Sarcoptes scabiei]|nr:peroxinectin [Sarcoptes scabiei]